MTTSIITNNHHTMPFNTISLPDKEIEQMFDLQGTLNVEESLHVFQEIIRKISSWLESVHLALFSLEQNINQGSLGIHDIASLEATITQMVPTISSLSELNDVMLTSGVEEHLTRLKVTKIQSEWSSLQHYLASVKQQLLSSEEQNSLICEIGNLLMQIDDVSIMIFDFQERKQLASTILPTSSLSEKISNSDDVFSIGSSSDGSTLVNITAGGSCKEDNGIAEIELAFNATFEAIQTVHTKANQMRLQELAKKRFDKLKERWEQLQVEVDHFKNENKEDRWSTVFKRVSDQVDVMIDGLEKSVAHCQSFIHQIKSWSQQQQSSYKAILRSFQHKTNTCPIDLEKFKSIEKGFEAKLKYYTPSIDRMLAILGNGISSRGAKEIAIQQRHDMMTQRWNHLKEVMHELKSKDLIEAERLLSGGQNTKKTTNWKGIRYRTPEPNAKHDPKVQNNYPPLCSPLRGSISDSSSSSQLPKRAYTPKSGSVEDQHTKVGDFYEEDERHFGIDILKPKKNTKRTVLPHQVERPSTTQDIRSRTKTPSRRDLNVSHPQKQTGGGYRSKSSIGDIRVDRVMSPSTATRSITPSLIPRAKTPKNTSRTNSPMIPHTKSTRTKNLSPTPAGHFSQSTLRKKQSMPLLRHKPSFMEISVNEDGKYLPDPKDPLDLEVAQIMNASPISIRCQRVDSGKYYFGSEQSLSSMGGRKLYTCKLMVYTDRKNGKLKNNKVLIRVGGGWQDLEFFLLEHSSLMASDVVVRTYTGKSSASPSDPDSRLSPKGWKN